MKVIKLLAGIMFIFSVSTSALLAEPSIDGIMNDAEWSGHQAVDYSYPSGNEYYDVEKLGLWIEDSKLYIGLQTDFNLNGGRYYNDSIYRFDEYGNETQTANPIVDSGDFALDFNGDGSYEAGIDFQISGATADLTFFTIDPSKWKHAVVYDSNSPWTADPDDYIYYEKTALNDFTANVSFQDDGLWDRDPGDAIELSINLDTLSGALAELFDDNDYVKLHWTMECGNDGLTVGSNIPSSPTPEPATFLLYGLGLIGIGALGRKKKK